MGLHSLELVNDIFSFFHDLKSINSAIIKFNNSYLEIKSAYLQKIMTQDNYLSNYQGYVRKLNELKLILTKETTKAIEIVAKIRVIIKVSRPLFDWIFFLTIKKRI
jgi:hypothetical protein